MNQLKELMEKFNVAIDHKKDGKFNKQDVDNILASATPLFDSQQPIPSNELKQLAAKYSELAGEGVMNKGRAMKKLQGTSRAASMQAVLMKAVD